jgi:hypothetical protein
MYRESPRGDSLASGKPGPVSYPQPQEGYVESRSHRFLFMSEASRLVALIACNLFIGCGFKFLQRRHQGVMTQQC